MKSLITLSSICLFAACSVALADSHLGKDTYTKHCAACHAPAVANALKAPAFESKVDWKARFATATKASKADPKKYPTAMDYLVAQVKNGLGAMPPGGMCADSSTKDGKCKDAVYQAAINYMSGNDKKKK